VSTSGSSDQAGHEDGSASALMEEGSGGASLLPGERTVAALGALVCVSVSIATYVTKREKMKDAAREAKEKKEEAIQQVRTVPKVDFELKDVSLDITVGHLVMVVGAVGSGKSSFVAAILGEMEKRSGKVALMSGARVSYVSQQCVACGRCCLLASP
jgi:ABC-type sugar transport system ATPase subunit